MGNTARSFVVISWESAAIAGDGHEEEVHVIDHSDRRGLVFYSTAN